MFRLNLQFVERMVVNNLQESKNPARKKTCNEQESPRASWNHRVPWTCQSNKRFLCDPGISVVAMVRSTQLPVGCLHLGWWLSTCPPPANYQPVRPLKIDRAGTQKERIVFATIHFHVRDVSFREGICFFHWVLLNEWTWTTQPPCIVWLIFGMSHIPRGSLQCFRILVVLHSLQQPCRLVQIQQGQRDPLQLMF